MLVGSPPRGGGQRCLERVEGLSCPVAWEGYANDDWIKPFETETGCKVNRKDAGSSDEMVALMRSGSGSEYDLVSASGDATLRLIYGGDVQPIDVDLIPDYKDFIPALQSPAHNTLKGLHYGLSYEWGPNVLLWNASKVTKAPSSWASIYDPAYKQAGACTKYHLNAPASYLQSIKF